MATWIRSARDSEPSIYASLMMNFKKLHHQKLVEIVLALRAHGLLVTRFNIRRIAFLINFHITKHQIFMTPYQAGNLLKLEIVETLVHTKGRGFFYTSVPASLN